MLYPYKPATKNNPQIYNIPSKLNFQLGLRRIGALALYVSKLSQGEEDKIADIWRSAQW